MMLSDTFGLTHLRIWSIIAGVLAIAAANAVLAGVLTRLLSERMQQRESEVSQEFLSAILTAEESEQKLFSGTAPNAELTSFASHVRAIPGIIRVNIYSPDMFIRYSSEPNLVGLKFEGNHELSESFAGTLVSKLENVTEADKSEHIALEWPKGGRLIEAYIPVVNEAGKVITVVEYYKDASKIDAVIAELTRLIWLVAALGGLALLAILGVGLLIGGRTAATAKSGPQ